MATGDPLLIGHKSKGKNLTWLVAEPEPFGGFSVFRAGEDGKNQFDQRDDRFLDGIHGVGSSQTDRFGGAGVVGFGAANAGEGVVGLGGTLAGVGVFGIGGPKHSEFEVGDVFPSGPGVVGHAPRSQSGATNTSPGVVGLADGNDGVFGYTQTPGRSGVRGLNPSGAGTAVGVFGQTRSPQGLGVVGFGASGGVGTAGAGKIGVLGVGPVAGFFVGDVTVQGDLTCTGTKSAAVPAANGTLRRLYCLESPESWFEDFGEAKLVRGKARVKIAPDFKRCLGRGAYHVFLTPLGDCNGLYLASRSSGTFEVRELGGGTATLRFSYRVVAKRKGTESKRFEKLDLPTPPALPSTKELKAMAVSDDRLTSRVQAASAAHLKRKDRTSRTSKRSSSR